MAELKTRPTSEAAAAFLDCVADERRRKDCSTVVELMREATGPNR
ncbi:MAG TPA: hypothetical protein P5234_02800 [Thermoanaerobaculaceae bacterium]|nr:hypothetical protein [Thermoanaerobaculaceae bacterium]HRS15157.1 hypothetical protein [Thermoanaerobaculaceae bacterium]